MDLPSYEDAIRDKKYVSECPPPLRTNFMGNVFNYLSTQLLFTVIYTYCVWTYPLLQNFMQEYIILWYLAMIGSIGCCLWLSLAPSKENFLNDESSGALMDNDVVPLRENNLPWYIISKRSQLFLLGIFTLCESYMVSLITLQYNYEIVMSAMLVTMVITWGVVLVSKSGKFDYILEEYTSIYYWLNMGILLLIGMGISSLILGGLSSRFDLIYGWLGAIVFTVYLFIDTQLLFRKVMPNEDIKCAMMIYLDIINLFLSILRIMSHSNDD